MDEKVSKVLIPVPSYGFDPTEVAIPWKLLTERDVSVVFATPTGRKASPDSLMVSGEKLGIWKSVLRARQDAVAACAEMEKDESFCNPLKYVDTEEGAFAAIFLPGGHDTPIQVNLSYSTTRQLHC